MSASSDYLNVLTRLTEQQGQQQAEAVKAKAEALSGAQRANAAIWGQTIGNIGQYISQIPAQQLEMQKAKQQMAMQQAQLSTIQKTQQGQDNINGILSTMMTDNPDGSKTLDRNKLRQAFAAQNVPLNLQAETLKSLDDVDASLGKFQQAKIDHTADIANAILTTHKADEPISPEAIHLGLAIAKANGLADDASIAKINDLLAQGADPRQVLETARAQSEKYKKDMTPVKLGPGDVLTQMIGGQYQTVASNPKNEQPKTPAEFLFDSQNPNSPTQAISKKVYDLLQTAPTDSSGELKPVRVNGKMVFAVFDPKTKKLMYQGQDVTQTAEPPRDPVEAQAATIAASVAAENKREGFQERETALKAVADARKTYNTATAGVDTLRSTIQSAQKGNVTAAAAQSMLQTMATLKAEGFNRLNTVELGVNRDAGSFIQNIEGWFGKKVEGQPIPAEVQKDMQDFADILEKGAFLKYQRDVQGLKQIYGSALDKLPDVAAPTPQGPSSQPPPPAPSAAPTPNLRPNLQRRLGDK